MRSTAPVKHDACLVEIADSTRWTRSLLTGCLGAPRSRVVLAPPAIIESRSDIVVCVPMSRAEQSEASDLQVRACSPIRRPRGEPLRSGATQVSLIGHDTVTFDAGCAFESPRPTTCAGRALSMLLTTRPHRSARERPNSRIREVEHDRARHELTPPPRGGNPGAVNAAGVSRSQAGSDRCSDQARSRPHHRRRPRLVYRQRVADARGVKLPTSASKTRSLSTKRPTITESA